MDYGVTITKGLSDWRIIQQDAGGKADITIEGAYRRARISQEIPIIFTDVSHGDVTVKARIAREDNGESVVPWTICEITGEGRWRVRFYGVPAGGLYRLETYMEYEGWDGLSVTRGDIR